MKRFPVCVWMKVIMSAFFVLSLVSCEKELETPPGGVQVSQGTYLGVVHLSWNVVPGAQYYNMERQNPATGEWVGFGTAYKEEGYDNGYNLPGNTLPAGVHYKYRVQAGSRDQDDSGWSYSKEEGWSFVPSPLAVTAGYQEDGSVKVSWSETTDWDGVQNTKGFQYTVARRQKGETSFHTIYTKPVNENQDMFYVDQQPGSDPEYQVTGRYMYMYVAGDGSDQIGNVFVPSGPVAPENGSGVGPVDYNRLPINDVVSLSGKSVASVLLKDYGGSVYAGIIQDAVAEYGKPAVYRFNGTGWELQGGTYPEDIMNSSSLGHMDFARGHTYLWLAGLDHDSLYVFAENNDTWSTNLTVKNLGASGAPSSMAVATDIDGSILYLAITEAPDYNLKVLQWDGSDWQTVGGDENGYLTSDKDVFSLELQNLGGSIYVSYLTQNSDYNSTYHIRRLDNGTWTTVLDWTADNLMDVHMTREDASPCYFISSSQKPAEWPGGVFKVTSATTVENIIPAEAAWFADPQALTMDNEGRLFIVSTKFESAQKVYPAIFRYDGTQWRIFSGDFSDGTWPAGVLSGGISGTDIYYVYGDAGDLASDYQPKTLKAAKFTVK